MFLVIAQYRKRKRYTQLDFRVNLVMQLVDGYSATSKKVKSLMTIYLMANGDPTNDYQKVHQILPPLF
jgi:hypothetical protein